MNTPLGRRWKLSEMKCLLVGLVEGLIFTSDPSTGRCSSRNQKSWTSPGPVLRLSSQGGREKSPEVVDVTRCRCHTETPISPSLSQRGKQRLTFQVWIKASAPRAVASFNKFYAAIFLRIGCLSRVDSFTFWNNKTYGWIRSKKTFWKDPTGRLDLCVFSLRLSRVVAARML